MESAGRKGNSPYVRRQSVRHFLLAEDWDRAADALSDLHYVEARVRNSELLPLLMDYSLAEKSLPEGEAEKKLEEERQAELDRYAREMTEYAATWTRIREESGECLHVFQDQHPVMAVSATTDGKQIVSGSGASNLLRIWNTESGECLRELKGHEGLVTSLIVDSDGRRIISGSQDQTLRIWDIKSGECIKEL